MRTKKIEVVVRVLSEMGKCTLNEIKGLKEGTIIKGSRIGNSNIVEFKWNGEDACLYINENCYEIATIRPKVQRKKYYRVDWLCGDYCYRTTMDVPYEAIAEMKDVAKALGHKIKTEHLYTRTIKL